MAPAAVCDWALEELLAAGETADRVELSEGRGNWTMDLAPAAVCVSSEVSEGGVEA